MERLFIVYDDVEYTYKRLVSDINTCNEYSNYVYVKGNNPYKLFVKILHSLIYDYSVELLDGDFSETELQELGIDLDEVHLNETSRNDLWFSTYTELIGKIEDAKNWRLTLYTSGTTGRPKKVSHSFETLTRHVKRHERFQKDVWAYAFNPTHMAGLQVFFQAFLNKNTLIYLFDRKILEVSLLLNRYEITSISATPTFYRNMIPYLQDDTFPSMWQLTFGGERYDESLEEPLRKIFPNAKLRNVYASTEAGSLFTAVGDIFAISEELSRFIKISAEDELLIHHSVLGESTTLTLLEEWFQTGDLVKRIDDRHFIFMSRQTELINVGGYKVNPIEVEAILNQIPGVLDSLVKGRENSVTGEIIVADIIKAEEVDAKVLQKEIKNYASANLQEWKIPRLIKFVDELAMTRTGKKGRA